ncbi:acylphosphatase [Salicibibacter cibarius]|uniref:Acylphosphatase n=1 Tax=Salicibibacter cibarius TaxID=2743000 RepID=A0A7T7C9T8_9BACI|nr:acylphosphatase [Salicibibacter cibarius]QQK74189.1 acylphosphatase [Salicibibacter cibarius]
MEDIKNKWLPHLIDAVPSAGQGKRISTYTIALEGWRRGIPLKFYRVHDEEDHLKIRYSLNYEGNEHHFSLSMGDKVSDEAFEICNNKHLTKEHLSKAGVPVAEGKKFMDDVQDEDIVEYAKSIGFPVVVKPVDDNAGKGVFANILDEQRLKKVLVHVRQELAYTEVLLEKYMPGKEFRIYVIEDRVLGAMNRRPANVIGDGVHTIKELIDLKNTERKKNPHTTSRLIKIDDEILDFIDRAGYTLETVPKDGEFLYIRQKSNLARGGEAIDVTEQLTPELKQIAIDAGKAIPGLPHYGIDMIVDQENNTGVILEVNSRPGFGGHLFPMVGEPRDFAKEIIDYYFPETKDIERTNLFFNFNKIIEPLKTRAAISTELPIPPTGKLYGRKYIVTGNVEGQWFRKWVKRQALKRDLHGYAKPLDNGDLEVVVAGKQQSVVDRFKKLLFEGKENAAVEEIKEYDWEDQPLRVDFQLKKKRTTKRPKNVHQKYQRVSKEYNKIINSTSWRLTYPLRYAKDLLKRMIKR